MKKFTQQLQISGHSDYRALSFSPVEATIVSLCQPDDNPMIKDVSMINLKAFAAKLYRRASAKYGNSTKDEQESEDNVRFIMEDLTKNGLLRIKEVTYILDEGLSGSYDKEDVRHFSSSRFCKWIKTYLEEHKQAAMKKKAQFDHQSLTPPTPQEQEIKTKHETFFGELANRLEKGELPKNFSGFDAIYEECERLRVFDPLDLEEKRIIAAECKAYSGFEGAALVAFSRKVAYLYVLHQAAMVAYTLGELVRYVAGHDKNMSGYLQDLAKTRLAEYAEYRAEEENYINNAPDAESRRK